MICLSLFQVPFLLSIIVMGFSLIFPHCFIQGFCVELECCGRTLAELIAAVQDLGRRHPLLSKQLSDSIAKLGEIHHHTARLAEYRTVWLKKVVTVFV